MNGSVRRTTQDSKRKHPQKFHKQTDRHKKNKDSKKVARGSKWAGRWIVGIEAGNERRKNEEEEEEEEEKGNVLGGS